MSYAAGEDSTASRALLFWPFALEFIATMDGEMVSTPVLKSKVVPRDSRYSIPFVPTVIRVSLSRSISADVSKLPISFSGRWYLPSRPSISLSSFWVYRLYCLRPILPVFAFIFRASWPTVINGYPRGCRLGVPAMG